ncbi:MAG: hypothetical protein JSR64_12640 [Nitrospira sp.]|nr:hypothetical protein [Nitrospira sp.]MBS0174877.1 hypothetical protein [Nitrospira sp.]MBX3337106.1 hypothetical protein [Nitrospira sp.]MCW5780114.1 hypothetical protein [Nitrospira sp.]
MNQRHRLLSILVFTSILGCAPSVPPLPDSNVQIVIEPSTSKHTLPAWLFYAGTRAFWMEKKFFELHPEATSYQHTFLEEVAARGGCTKIWQEIRAKDGRRDRYLDDLATVEQSGYLREYVWIYFRERGWSEPPDLHLMEFERWRRLHLQSHEPETKAIAQFKK